LQLIELSKKKINDVSTLSAKITLNLK